MMISHKIYLCYICFANQCVTWVLSSEQINT